MPYPRIRRVLAALPLAALAACSSTQQAAPAGPSTNQKPSVSQKPSATSTSAAAPSSAAPATPTLADLPDEGRNLASCKDGHCRVTVRDGDRITVPASVGGTMIAIVKITPAMVKMQQSGYGGGVSTFTFYPAQPATGLGGTKFVVAFLDLRDGSATMQVDA